MENQENKKIVVLQVLPELGQGGVELGTIEIASELQKKGIENYVASELIAGDYKLFYWRGKENSEFEFVIEYDSSFIPIDVKKSKGSLNSLEKFKNHNELYIAIKISENNLGYDETKKILNIPFYYVPFLVHTLKQGELNNLISLIKKNC